MSGQLNDLIARKRQIEEFHTETNLHLTKSKKYRKSSINDVICNTVVDIDSPFDGSIDRRRTSAYVYNEDELLIRITSETDVDVNGTVEYSNVKNLTYNDKGRIIHSQRDLDNNNDGILDGIETVQYQYNDAGLLEKVDLMIDFSFAEPEGIYSVTYLNSYDTNGRLIQVDFEDFYDGVQLYLGTYFYSYNPKGLLNTVESEEYYYLDTGPNFYSTESITYSYDHQDFLISYISETDFRDGAISVLRTATYENNKFGKPLTILYSRYSKDSDKVGTPEFTSFQVNSYCSLSVPTLNEWSIIILTISMIITGIVTLQRQKRTFSY